MPDAEPKTPANPLGSLTSRFTGSHGSSAILALAGMALVALGWNNPDVSDKIVQAVIGGVLALLGGLQAQKVGLTKKLDEQDQRQKEVVQETVTTAMDKTYDQQMLSVTQAILRMGESVETLASGQKKMATDIATKHQENKDDHAALIATLAADRDTDRQANEAAHNEHRERIGKLESGQDRLSGQMNGVTSALERLGEKIDQRNGNH